jgi:hypothetical protein
VATTTEKKRHRQETLFLDRLKSYLKIISQEASVSVRFFALFPDRREFKRQHWHEGIWQTLPYDNYTGLNEKQKF